MPLIPLTPYISIMLPRVSAFLLVIAVLSPGFSMDTISGATQRYPTNLQISPGCAFYALWLRRIILIDLGMPPGGILLGSYCTLSCWKSAYSESDISNYHEWESQFRFKHFLGSVYLNCCYIGWLNLLQNLHRNTPTTN